MCFVRPLFIYLFISFVRYLFRGFLRSLLVYFNSSVFGEF